MRILANYGYKNNGDTYSVTFETMGDVPKEQADNVVDELFSMAKAAIDRQVKGTASSHVKPVTVADPFEFPPREEVVIPRPTSPERPPVSKTESSRKDKIVALKDPSAPATLKQKNLIIRLAKEQGRFIENLSAFTMEQASHAIEELMAV